MTAASSSTAWAPTAPPSGNWLESIESQVIEGGAGDYIVVAGAGHPSVKAHARIDGDETYWDAAADIRTIAEGRLNWFGRDPQWKDQLGFRGRRDVERPTGAWNRQEIVADGDRLTTLLNGVTVNEAFEASHRAAGFTAVGGGRNYHPQRGPLSVEGPDAERRPSAAAAFEPPAGCASGRSRRTGSGRTAGARRGPDGW